MSKPFVSDALWGIVQPLLAPERPKPKGGRPRVSDRAALAGILFVLHTGCPWEWLPQELGCGSGVTCWRRLRAWQQAGVWHRLHTVLLDHLHAADQLDWSRASLDAASVPAKRGARKSAPPPPTGASRALSAISSWTGGVSPWRSGSRRPTSTTASSSRP